VLGTENFGIEALLRAVAWMHTKRYTLVAHLLQDSAQEMAVLVQVTPLLVLKQIEGSQQETKTEEVVEAEVEELMKAAAQVPL